MVLDRQFDGTASRAAKAVANMHCQDPETLFVERLALQASPANV